MRTALVLLSAAILTAPAAPAQFACAEPPNFDGAWRYGFVEPSVPIAENEVRFAAAVTNDDEIVQAARVDRGGAPRGCDSRG